VLPQTVSLSATRAYDGPVYQVCVGAWVGVWVCGCVGGG
jgi:hypothetical protein